MSRLAWGLSQHTNSASLSIKVEMKAKSRPRRSSFAITSVCLAPAALLPGRKQLRAVGVLLPALNLGVLGSELAGSDAAQYGGALCVQP